MTPIIIWFRNDLRIEEHPAVAEAASTGAPLVFLYIHSPEEEGNWPLGGASRAYLHGALARLQKAIPQLLFFKGSSLAILEEVIRKTCARSLFFGTRYEPYALKRDAELTLALQKKGIHVKAFNTSLLTEPWDLKPYTVFTPFYKAALKIFEPHAPLPKPQWKPYSPKISSLDLESLELLTHKRWEEKMLGSSVDQLDDFLDQHLASYESARDFPALENGVSHLSPALHFGEISPRTLFYKSFGRPGADSYIRQLFWRDFAHHLLYYFPKTPQEPLREKFRSFPWKMDNALLKAWKKGLTGYPFVDAGMRQLWQTGWMHNRVRMVVASFLVKDLLIPWQEGASWFWDTLVDADLANNTFGWQWTAGCGADAAPYFRIFNPTTQGQKFDPKGEYVRKWVPELSALPDKWIHQPMEAPDLLLNAAGVRLGKDYPFPIVDHAEARERALQIFSDLSFSGE